MVDQELRARRLAAQAASERVLSHGPGATLQSRLTRLAAASPGSYDLEEWTDIYGDGIVSDLEQRVADLLGTEDAAFFPTGTMAQQVALRCWAGRTGNPVVALHPLAHPVMHERDSLTTLAGLRTIRTTTSPRTPSAQEIAELDEPFGTLMLELPLREAGFLLPTWEELTATVAAARDRDAVVHFDGARLWECTTHFGRPLSEIAALADSVYVSFYKSLDGISGAALAGPKSLIEEARAWRHRYGGMLFQQWPAALAALIGLDTELPKLESYVAHAKVVAAALDGALKDETWFRIHPEVPHTHQFQVWLPHPADALTEASIRQAEEKRTTLFRYWVDGLTPGVSMTEVTIADSALSWTPADIAEAVREFLEYL
jgi:threonine aldolase